MIRAIVTSLRKAYTVPSCPIPTRAEAFVMEKPQVTAAGILILTREDSPQFLLMRHADRWDLPKGHSEPGEAARETALREMHEETSIEPDIVDLDPNFDFQLSYPVRYRKDGTTRTKTVTYFLGRIEVPCEIVCTEHEGYQWFPWMPPHDIQEMTINPLLRAVESHFAEG